MARRLIAVALSCAAIAVAIACMPATAMAVGWFEADFYPASVGGKSGKGVHVFDTEAGQISCATSLGGTLMFATSILSLTPKYTECSAFGFSEATVNPEGCSWSLHSVEVVAEDEYASKIDLVCPPGQSVKVTAGNCAVEYPSQTGKSTVELFNDTAASVDEIELAFKLGSLVHTVTNDGSLCPFNGTGTKYGWSLASSEAMTLSAPNWGEPTGFRVSSSESSGGPTARFKSGFYPASLESLTEKTSVFNLETEAGALECKLNLFYNGKLSGEASEISLFRWGYNCTAFGFESITTNWGECRHGFHAEHEVAEDEFDGHLNLVCPSKKSIKITAGTCIVEIRSQWNLGTVKMVNDINDVTITPEVTGMTYVVTQDGLGCPFSGTGMRSGGSITSSGPATFTGGNWLYLSS